jgi:alanyl-tRNA synthetase
VYHDILHSCGTTHFVGYDHHEQTAQVCALVVDGVRVSSICDGQAAQVVLDRTPFYGEMGGQLGDTGELVVLNGSADAQVPSGTEAKPSSGVFTVEDTKVFEKAVYTHVGHIDGSLHVGDTVRARIDSVRRERIERNHTATHLLHYALREILGEHVKQAGSLVAPDHLRFDFTHFEPLSSEQLVRIEEMANGLIMEDGAVSFYETSLAKAREQGVTALFGEKYGEQVRVLEAGEKSRELCGGTHVKRTAQIGFMKIVGESGVGANMRRIEAVTSFDALAHVNRNEQQLKTMASLLKASPAELCEKLEAVLARNRELEALSATAKKTALQDDAAQLLTRAQTCTTDTASYQLVVARLEGLEIDDLRLAWDKLRESLGTASAAVLGTVRANGMPLILAAATNQAVEAGFNAGALIKQIAACIEGTGGGKPTMAQAGGKQAQGLDAALDTARKLLGLDA